MVSVRERERRFTIFLVGFGEGEPISLEADQYFCSSQVWSHEIRIFSSLYDSTSFFANPGVILLIVVDI